MPMRGVFSWPMILGVRLHFERLLPSRRTSRVSVFARVFLDEIAQRDRIENRLTIDRLHDIAVAQARFGRRRVRLSTLVDHRRFRGQNQDLPHALAPPTARLGAVLASRRNS